MTCTRSPAGRHSVCDLRVKSSEGRDNLGPGLGDTQGEQRPRGGVSLEEGSLSQREGSGQAFQGGTLGEEGRSGHHRTGVQRHGLSQTELYWVKRNEANSTFRVAAALPGSRPMVTFPTWPRRSPSLSLGTKGLQAQTRFPHIWGALLRWALQQ